MSKDPYPIEWKQHFFDAGKPSSIAVAEALRVVIDRHLEAQDAQREQGKRNASDESIEQVPAL